MDLGGFRFFAGSTLYASRRELPGIPATYLVFFRAGDRVLETSGYFDVESRLPWRLGEFYHLYTGASGAWGVRIRQHLAGDAFSSTLRRTLISLELEMCAVSNAGFTRHDVTDDTSMTSWLSANVLIGVLETERAFEVESEILRVEPTPFNIDRRRGAPYAQMLVAARNSHFPKRRPMYRNGTPCSVSRHAA